MKKLIVVGPYLPQQGRFRHPGDEHIAEIQKEVDARWEVPRNRVEHGN
jgi:hypothetical protein